MNEEMLDAILDRHCWVFDLDGTLTMPVHDFAAIRAELGVPDGGDILRHIASLPAEAARPLIRRLHEIEDELVQEKTVASRGAVCFIEYLHQRGDRLGILTRNTRENALLVLDAIGIGGCFRPEWVLGRHDAPHQPDPGGILQLAELWQVAPEGMVMVGDFLYDLQAGQAAGAATIHLHGHRPGRWPEWTD